MSIRITWLIILLFIRCILGLSLSLRYLDGQRIRVTGYPNNMYVSESNCIIKISHFIFSTKNFCAEYQGFRIRVSGTITRRVIDSFNGNLWLSNAEIDTLEKFDLRETPGGLVRKKIENFRNYLVLVYKNSVPEPEAGLTEGVVLGYKEDIGQNFYDALIKSGTIHIAVASGYNILLVGGTMMSILFWFMKRTKATFVSIIIMILYSLLAGGDPPVVRALIMAALMYVGLSIGRCSVSWWSLALTSGIMLLFDPTLITSPSFQLSVAASFGLMVVAPLISGKIQNKNVANIFEGLGIVSTLSTMIITLPILWWHFGRMSLIGIVSNILILPLVPIIMLLGVGALLSPGLFVWPLYAVAHLAVRLIWFLGS